MDYKEKFMLLINDKTLPIEQRKKLEEIYNNVVENKDERIRTFLHHTFTAQYLCKNKLGKWHGEPVVNILDWLEKQGEQKPVETPKPKFKVGDWVLNDICLPIQIVSIESDMYVFNDGSAISISFIDENYHLWTIQDAKAGDVLATSAGAFIYNGNNGGGSCPGSYCGINTLGEFKTGVETHWTGKKVYPATKEQRDLLFQKMKEAGYEFDFEKKELKKIEQKPILA